MDAMRLMTRMKIKLLKWEIQAYKTYFAWKQSVHLLDQYPELGTIFEFEWEENVKIKKQLDKVWELLTIERAFGMTNQMGMN